jgi:hypothetical protein
MRRARQLVATHFPPIDVVLCTPQDAEQADQDRSPFLQSILESGVTVYTCQQPVAAYQLSIECVP